jgi:hypothetical protein
MNGNQPSIATLASLAHRALNDGASEYARNKALIAQFFSGDSPPVSRREKPGRSANNLRRTAVSIYPGSGPSGQEINEE